MVPQIRNWGHAAAVCHLPACLLPAVAAAAIDAASRAATSLLMTGNPVEYDEPVVHRQQARRPVEDDEPVVFDYS
jgi:hypothetical protein